MRKIAVSILLCLAFGPWLVFAKEPANLSLIKQNLKQYHDSGQYAQDLANTTQEAMRYLEMRAAKQDFNHKKPALVLDIDETSLSNYPDMLKYDFGGTETIITAEENQGDDPAIVSTLKLYRLAKEKHIAVFFVTGRQESAREATVKNLQCAGYTNWDGLFLRTKEFAHTSAILYKTAIRKQITDQGYDIILNIGDQKSDLTGGYADKGVKLVNPYYFIP